MAADNTVVSMGPARRRRDKARQAQPMFTIDQVSRHCGLPGPVVMQLVERTWTTHGWMYTEQQLHSSVEVAAELRRRNASQPPVAVHEPIDTIMCDGCGAVIAVTAATPAGWHNAAQPDTTPGGDPLGRDYCPRCVVPCPACVDQAENRHCRACNGAGVVVRRF